MHSNPFNPFHSIFFLALFVFCGICPSGIFAQHADCQFVTINPFDDHRADRWYFGNMAGLDFRNQEVVADMTNYVLNVTTSPAIISDENGNILLYSDGNRVFNRYGSIMPDGEGLHGFSGSSMPVLIVPKPASDSIYYILTTHRPKQNPYDPSIVYGLEYNEVDIFAKEDSGDVIVKNRVLLEPEVSSKLTAVKHSNGTDYWVVAHRFASDEFCAFLVTENGIDSSAYVSSHVGSVHLPPGETNNSLGYMKISPDGTKLALAVYGSSIIEIFDFNTTTGKVTNAITSPPVFQDAYGVEFSPDTRYLYISITSTSLPQPNYTPPSYILQFDIQNGGNIFNDGYYDTIAVDTNGSYFGGMQLATDGRIYVSRSPYGNLSVGMIANPERPGTACNFVSNAIDLNGRHSRFGLPDFVQSFFDLPHFNAEQTFYNETTIFTLQNSSFTDNVSWDFGDPGSGSNSSTDFQPVHVFSAPGTYTVQVTEYYNGILYGPYEEPVVITDNTSIAENHHGKGLFSVYPNPGNGKVHIQCPGNEEIREITLWNTLGGKVYKSILSDNTVNQKEIIIDPGKVPDGIYFIDIQPEQGDNYVIKYILQHAR